MRGFVFAFTIALLAGSGVPVTADTAPAAAAAGSAVDFAQHRLETMLRTGHCDAGWLSASFLAQVPAAKVDEVIADVKRSLGEYRSLTFTSEKFVAKFEKGTDDVLIHLDSDMKIDGLLFRPPSLSVSSLADGLRALESLPGTVSYVIEDFDRTQRAAFHESQSLAVGSAFKLAVLNALEDEIAKGRLHWTDVVSLKPQWKSLPSGILQKWPDDTPVTLATLATEMISISDNTAADALIRTVGPDALKPYADENQPFLTTREAFTLKSTPQAESLAAYRDAASSGARARILERIDELPLPAVDQVVKTPTLAVEWHFSVRRLCDLMQRVSDLPLMSVNPGVADAAAFRHVAYKGGSDLGVINLTTMVTTERGTKLCFSATLNDSAHAIDESAFETAYGGVLRLLQHQ